MGQSNPYGSGTLALIVELGLIVLTLADATLVLTASAVRSTTADSPSRSVAA